MRLPTQCIAQIPEVLTKLKVLSHSKGLTILRWSQYLRLILCSYKVISVLRKRDVIVFDVILWPILPFLLDLLGNRSSETPKSNVGKSRRCNDSKCFWLSRLTNLDCSFAFVFGTSFPIPSFSNCFIASIATSRPHLLRNFFFLFTNQEMSRCFPGSVRTKASFECWCAPLRPKDVGVQPALENV